MRVTAYFCTRGMVTSRVRGRAAETASTTSKTKDTRSDGRAPEELNFKISLRPRSSKNVSLMETLGLSNFELANNVTAFCACSVVTN